MDLETMAPSINGAEGMNYSSLYDPQKLSTTKPVRYIDFKTLVSNVADGLSKENIEKLCYCYKNELGLPLGTQTSALVILDRLEEKGVYSQNDVDSLEEVLRKIDRCDLITNLIEPFKEQGALHKSMSMPTTQHHQYPPPLHRQSSQPTSLQSATGYPQFSQTSHPSHPSHPTHASLPAEYLTSEHRAQSLVSIPEDEQFPMEGASLVVSGTGSKLNYPLQFHTPNLRRRSKEGYVELMIGKPRSLTEDIYSSHQKLCGYQTPNGMYQGGNNLTQDDSKLTISVESTQFQFPLDNPPAEVQSKKEHFDSMTASIREQQEVQRSITPVPVASKTAQPVNEDQMGDKSLLLLPNSDSRQLSIHQSMSRKEEITEQNKTSSEQINQNHQSKVAVAEQQPEESCEASRSHDTPPRKKWRHPGHIFKVKRKKLYEAICNSSPNHCAREKLVIPTSNSGCQGPKLVMELYPGGLDSDHNNHMTLKTHVTFSDKDPKCRDLVRNCRCWVQVEVVSFELNSRKEVGKEVGKSTGKIELNRDSRDMIVMVHKLVNHKNVIYGGKEVKYIQFQVTATLISSELMETESVYTDDHEYLLINPVSEQS